MINRFIGIDYGSKKAGTTAVCYLSKSQLTLVQSKKGKDADVFLSDIFAEVKPLRVFIDAPLSLPSVYTGTGCDYFYRVCDRDAHAMSPMFLGGLTARAMKLANQYESKIEFFEAYPKGIVRELLPKTQSYKKQKLLFEFFEELKPQIPFSVSALPASWHQMDSLLAWLIGYRYQEGEAKSLGKPKEGLIWV